MFNIIRRVVNSLAFEIEYAMTASYAILEGMINLIEVMCRQTMVILKYISTREVYMMDDVINLAIIVLLATVVRGMPIMRNVAAFLSVLVLTKGISKKQDA